MRLAAVLYCVEHGPVGQINGATIRAAVKIARYLIPHAEVVLNMMQAKEGTGDDEARYVLRRIKRHSRKEFTKREAYKHGKRRFPMADDIDPALEELARCGYIRERTSEPTGPGRRPSPTYEVNPAAFENEISKKRSQYSHNSANQPENGNSENIGSAFEQSDKANRVQVTI